MKMNLDMSFEEGMNVVNALRECAIENGWDEDELDECGVMEEYTAAVDAALTAMGISVSIDSEPADADENKYCDSAADCYFCKSEDEDEEEEVDEFGVPMDYESDFDEDEEEDEEKEEEDTCKYTLTPKGEFVARALELGVSFEGACELASLLFDDNKGE